MTRTFDSHPSRLIEHAERMLRDLHCVISQDSGGVIMYPLTRLIPENITSFSCNLIVQMCIGIGTFPLPTSSSPPPLLPSHRTLPSSLPPWSSTPPPSPLLPLPSYLSSPPPSLSLPPPSLLPDRWKKKDRQVFPVLAPPLVLHHPAR